MDQEPRDSQGASEDLVRRASVGDPVAVDVLLERHLPALIAYVRLKAGPLIRKNESCADIVQSVCRGALEGAEDFEYRGEGAFRKWLFARALAKLVDRQRYYLAERRHPDRVVTAAGAGVGGGVEAMYASLCGPGTVAAAREDLERFEAAFDRLSPEHQEVIMLSRILGMKHAEVAEELGCNEGAARARLFRAMTNLALRMKEGQGPNRSA